MNCCQQERERRVCYTRSTDSRGSWHRLLLHSLSLDARRRCARSRPVCGRSIYFILYPRSLQPRAKLWPARASTFTQLLFIYVSSGKSFLHLFIYRYCKSIKQFIGAKELRISYLAFKSCFFFCLFLMKKKYIQFILYILNCK